MMGTGSLRFVFFVVVYYFVNDTGIGHDFLGFIVWKSPEKVQKFVSVI